MMQSSEFKIARLRAGMDQRGLAQKLEVSESLVSKWESGRAQPSPEQARLLSQLLGPPTFVLFPQGLRRSPVPLQEEGPR